MAFVDQGLSSRKTAAIGGVVLVHLAIGYAFVSGLALNIVPFIEHHTTLLPPIADPVPPPPIPPAPPQRHRLPLPAPLDHDLPIPPQTGPIFGGDLHPLPPVPSDPPAPPQAAKLSHPLQVRGDRSLWVTTEDYPSPSIRDGEEGRVEVTVRVGTNGRVTSCQVTGSSGHDALDKATCFYYTKRARFLPALAADGTPVEASHVDRVRWQLPAQ